MPQDRILALLQPQDVAAAERAAHAAGLELVSTDSVAGLLRELSSEPWPATLVSLSTTHVDEALVRRVADLGSGGALLLTAPAVSLERALLMERVGAVGLLREPLDPADLSPRLTALADEGREVPLPEPADEHHEDGLPTLVGEGPAMGTVFETVAKVSRAGSTVLITGESGTGKELVAQAIHAASDRRTGPFVAINCAAIPEHLLESELFGHERGAFTGAVARRVGRFERADRGTLFLDEIGDMSLVLQAKVLRALEERAVERVGGEKTVPVDVRVIAATNQKLEESTRAGRFREDLYFRLAVVELELPPLRARGPDLRRLALHFGAVFSERHGRPVRAITERALERLEASDWPGNVRELRNVMDRAVLLAHGEVIRASDLRLGAAAPRGSAQVGPDTAHGYAPELSLEEVESDHIRRVLTAVDGHMARAAATLGIHRNTLTRKIKHYGIDGDSRVEVVP
jgi:DNA-binding NtrC family response regulator